MVDPTPSPFGMTASIVYKIIVLCVDCCCGLSARTIMYLVIVASFPGPCHGQGPGNYAPWIQLKCIPRCSQFSQLTLLTDTLSLHKININII